MHQAHRAKHRHCNATPYEQHRDYVLAVLARRCGWLDAADREAAFHDAYAVMLEKDRDGDLEAAQMHGRQLRAYLVQTALFKALDEGKRAERKRTVALGDIALAERDPGPSVEDLVEARMDGLPVREMVGELSMRRQQIVTLRYFLDRSPDEIQQLLGITERVYRREHERAVRQLAERYEVVRSGRWCEGRRSLILAYVTGVAGPSRRRDARSHICSCPGCAHMATELRGGSRRPAARSSVVAG